MRFVFDDRKTAQAAAYLLELHGGRMPYIKLIKLMYLADRQSLVDTGYPITGARMVSMDKGPVLSEVLDCLTWGSQTESAWSEHISEPANYEVSLLRQTGTDRLSEYETELLRAVFRRFGHWDRWALVRYTHDLPEWQDPDGSSLPIDARVILREAGRSDQEILEMASQVEEIWAFRRLSALVP